MGHLVRVHVSTTLLSLCLCLAVSVRPSVRPSGRFVSVSASLLPGAGAMNKPPPTHTHACTHPTTTIEWQMLGQSPTFLAFLTFLASVGTRQRHLAQPITLYLCPACGAFFFFPPGRGRYIGNLLLGGVFWVLDFKLCGMVTPSPQFHAWWHVFVGISCWACVPLGAASCCNSCKCCVRPCTACTFATWRLWRRARARVGRGGGEG